MTQNGKDIVKTAEKLDNHIEEEDKAQDSSRSNVSTIISIIFGLSGFIFALVMFILNR